MNNIIGKHKDMELVDIIILNGIIESSILMMKFVMRLLESIHTKSLKGWMEPKLSVLYPVFLSQRKWQIDVNGLTGM